MIRFFSALPMVVRSRCGAGRASHFLDTARGNDTPRTWALCSRGHGEL
jgi:hypothetical protein